LKETGVMFFFRGNKKAALTGGFFISSKKNITPVSFNTLIEKLSLPVK